MEKGERVLEIDLCGQMNFARDLLQRRRRTDGADGSKAVCSDLTCDYVANTTAYKKRQQVEVFYKSLKSNANLASHPRER
jgi:hypothetical protein